MIYTIYILSPLNSIWISFLLRMPYISSLWLRIPCTMFNKNGKPRNSHLHRKAQLVKLRRMSDSGVLTHKWNVSETQPLHLSLR